MTERQKRAAATISFGVVFLATALLLILAVQTAGSTNPLGDHFLGRQFILLVHTRSTIELLLEALPAVLSVGMSIFAASRLKDWQFYATVAVTVLGIALCVYLVMELSDPDQARRFWAYSPVEDIGNYQTFTTAARPFLVAIGGWLVAILVTQLGMTARSQAGQAAAPHAADPATPPPPAAGDPPTPQGQPAAADPSDPPEPQG